MIVSVKRFLLLILLIASTTTLWGQRKVINYEAGMGARDASDPDVWILYNKVKAEHEGMILYADSALLNTQRNDFTAYKKVKIVLSDTTFIYGDQLFYDGDTRIVDVWDDTVIFIDGKTTLKTAHLSFDRNTSTASYTTWGHTVSGDRILDSRMGEYNSDTKDLFIHRKVVLQDSTSRLETDTLFYNTRTEVADFVSPTYIYSDSTILYSELGSYNTQTRYAVSTKASSVETGSKILTCDTLYYDEPKDYGRAYGNVVLFDTSNNVTCFGRYGETDGTQHTSLVTDSAMVVYVSEGDSLFMHADTLLVTNDTNNKVESIRAHHHVKTFRTDVQGMCDSAFYSVKDSVIQLFYDPVIWYDNYQCTADTIEMHHDSTGVRTAYLRTNSFSVEQMDVMRFNQLKGKQGVVYFEKGEPSYADILGNAQMVYYLTEEDSVGNLSLIGANAGVGSDMRIYFHERHPDRLVAYGKPDMHTYPDAQLPDELKRLKGFRWLDSHRPKSAMDIFEW